VITFHLKAGDVVTLPDGAQWFVTEDAHGFWLSDKPDFAKSQEKIAVSGHAKKARPPEGGRA
jgi:hypothetical protein